MRRFIPTLLIAVLLAGAALADLKITTKNTMAGQTSQGTTYIKGARQRSETQMGPIRSVTITQCDKKQTITLSDACKAYMVSPMIAPDAPAEADAAPPPSSGKPRKGGTLTIHTTSVDTKERQQMFGYTARHIKGSMAMTSSPDACAPVNTKMETDGWYADFTPAGVSCSAGGYGGGMGGGRPDCQDRIRYTGSGIRNPGYPLKLTTTIINENGERFTTTQETVELSKANLNPALFEIPKGYKQVYDYQGLYCAAAMQGGTGPDIPEEIEEEPTAGEQLRRRGGRGALCVAPIDYRAAQVVDLEAWRDVLIEELQNVNIESVKLEATTRREIQMEAAEKGCRHILYTDVQGFNAPARRRATMQVYAELMPVDDFEPWMEETLNGAGRNLEGAAQNAFAQEAAKTAEALANPR